MRHLASGERGLQYAQDVPLAKGRGRLSQDLMQQFESREVHVWQFYLSPEQWYSQRMSPHVVIVGGGFAGIAVARALPKAPFQVTLIDRSNHHVFQPLLYQVATAGLSPADIAAPIRSILHSQRNTEVLLGEVQGVDTRAREVILAHRRVSYDALVLATGARHSYFGHEEWEAHAPGLKSLGDATRIRRKILLAFEAAEMESDPEKRRALLTFVLIGAGPTGVEMAGAIAELAHQALKSDFRHIEPRATRVLLVEAGPRILASFSEPLAARSEFALQRLGVEILKGSRVERVDEQGITIGGQRIRAGTVIWSAGVRASDAGKWLGVAMDPQGRVIVGPDLSAPGLPDVFVIGDTAHVASAEGRTVPGVAPAALQMGQYVGRLLQARLRGKTVAPFRYRDKGNLATVGRSFAIAEWGRFRLWGALAWVFWLALHIYYLIDFRNKAVVLINWAWAYLTFQRGARLITDERVAPRVHD